MARGVREEDWRREVLLGLALGRIPLRAALAARGIEALLFDRGLRREVEALSRELFSTRFVEICLAAEASGGLRSRVRRGGQAPLLVLGETCRVIRELEAEATARGLRI